MTFEVQKKATSDVTNLPGTNSTGLPTQGLPTQGIVSSGDREVSIRDGARPASLEPGTHETRGTVEAAPTPATQVACNIAAHLGNPQKNGTVEFQMKLDPPELGRVNITLTSSGNEVRGSVTVANHAVKGLIESQLPELRQRLEAAGVNVGRLEVGVDQGGGNGGFQRHQARDFDFEPSPDNSAPPTANRFRGAPPKTDTNPTGSLDITV